ncbi:hypothetical protein SAMN04487783_0381 [Agrococcus baldri]|uniref:CHRD domain-containing protein n=1 Tax=Agrococcus baldri TaxID=153730 RepID=A0AA94HKK3_9MICO|nr:hypothetical protein [Agrococcus baldri]SFR99732.1 hypothetical protein SAMN04487783_0381 [Agrococcus baldri]
MKKTALLLAAPALGISLVAMGAMPAMAHDGAHAYETTLDEINNSGATGEVWIDVEGSQATVTLNASGLAAEFDGAPYPHVQHIHIGAMGTCPSPDADENGDGIISTTEGGPSYGEIGQTLSIGDADKSPEGALDLMAAPGGDTITYEETFDISEATATALHDGTAVVVVHGLDPATQPEGATEPSDLVPELPLAATSPALCGALAMAPAGGVDTGVTTAGDNGAEMGFVALGATLAAMTAAGIYVVRRRTANEN